MKQQREDSREVFRLTVLAHEANAEVDVILGWQMNTRTRNLRLMHEQILVQLDTAISQICASDIFRRLPLEGDKSCFTGKVQHQEIDVCFH